VCGRAREKKKRIGEKERKDARKSESKIERGPEREQASERE